MVKGIERSSFRSKLSDWSEAFYCTAMLLPYGLLFSALIFIPSMISVLLSFTYFNMVAFPTWRGLQNYVAILTQDTVFFQHVLPNTLFFSVMTGPGGFVIHFFMAWLLAQIQALPRAILTLCVFAPSLGAGLGMIWGILLDGHQYAWLNNWLMNLGLIDAPRQWWNEPDYIMTLGIIITLWGSLGIGFLAMLAGILNVNEEIYEAAYLDGIKNRFQEIIYVTIPQTMPMMLFSAILAIGGSFNGGGVMAANAGNPPPDYAGSVITSHIADFGGRMEHGYQAALAVVLFSIVWVFAKVAFLLFGGSED